MGNMPLEQNSSTATRTTRGNLYRATRVICYIRWKLEGDSRSEEGFLEKYDIEVILSGKGGQFDAVS